MYVVCVCPHPSVCVCVKSVWVLCTDMQRLDIAVGYLPQLLCTLTLETGVSCWTGGSQNLARLASQQAPGSFCLCPTALELQDALSHPALHIWVSGWLTPGRMLHSKHVTHWAISSASFQLLFPSTLAVLLQFFDDTLLHNFCHLPLPPPFPTPSFPSHSSH